MGSYRIYIAVHLKVSLILCYVISTNKGKQHDRRNLNRMRWSSLGKGKMQYHFIGKEGNDQESIQLPYTFRQ